MSVFVIRHFDFAYNDEWYMKDGELGRIKAVFDNRASAEAELQRLVVKFMRAEELSGHEVFCEPEEELMGKLNAFCLERCGEALTDEYGDAYQIPSGLNDTDVFELAKLADFMSYQVVEVPDGGGFVALWLPAEERYVGSYDTEMIYHPSSEPFMSDLPDQLYEAFPVEWCGGYEDISHSPLLLRQLIASQPEYFSYDEAEQRLSLKKSTWQLPGAQVFALNALLKTPVFEVRQLSVEELVEMGA
ncbi:MAG: hypothetical protein Q7J58_07355 [Hydrogenophaga sp.]|uniref:hypothetical protein n=1 Tax=Hydrogenophaga sp. TaxID=1904254 RepID=UPI0027197490|nr:hypothetical protein [Hydrogenophaga sp.]MDO9569182.1 hypothetical protein [Hydrogenophaga sp.]